VAKIRSVFFLCLVAFAGVTCGSQPRTVTCTFHQASDETVEILIENENNADFICVNYCPCEGGKPSMIIDVDLREIELAANLRIEGQEFMDRVLISCVNGYFYYSGIMCEFEKVSLENGAELIGQCSFSFLDGRFYIARFECVLEDLG